MLISEEFRVLQCPEFDEKQQQQVCKAILVTILELDNQTNENMESAKPNLLVTRQM